MISILTGALKNIGDHLIGSRAKDLLREYVDNDVYEINRFGDIAHHLEKINSSSCLILCGGPAYTSDIYPSIYNLEPILDQIKVPIIPFGLGWSGKPFENENEFQFTSEAKGFLSKIHGDIRTSSCRDILTHKVLKNHQLENVTMTGCPVWYHLDSIDKKFTNNPEIKKIAISTGARADLFPQTIRLMKEVRKTFPDATIYATFHRGILPLIDATPRKGLSYTFQSLFALFKNIKVLDLSNSLDSLEVYDECDLHIGYRVHAHLYFLSKKTPSLLINEDGRGLGMVKSMNLPELNYNDPDVVPKTMYALNTYIESNFEQFQEVNTYILDKFEVMKDFLSSIPR